MFSHSAANNSEELKITMKVAVDPGHGMSNRTRNVYDTGATHIEGGVKHEEASIALKYGLSLWDAFRLAGHEVFMTRDDETDHAPVGERAGNAETSGCDVFVSLHLNDAEDDSARGLEVLYRGDDDVALAQALQDELIGVTGFRDRGIKKRTDLAVLKFNGRAVLIELGFIANDGDRNALLNPAMREAVCAAIARVVAGNAGVSAARAGIPVAVVVPPRERREVHSRDGEANVRSGPRKGATLIRVLKNGDVVDVFETRNGWCKVAPTAEHWVSGTLLRPVAAPRPGGGPVAGGSGLEKLMNIAAASPIARYRWKDRGVAPLAYIKGMALVYARAYCKYRSGDAAALAMGKAAAGGSVKDALTHYATQFAALGMDNSADGVDTLRHLFALMIGHGMRESSGRHCCGKDTPPSSSTASTAEAGLFQTSWNARAFSPLLKPMFDAYRANPNGFLDVFSAGVTCSTKDWKNWGTGDGHEFQRLSKICPAFNAEFTAVVLRKRYDHWGPVVRKEVELNPDAEAMLRDVQNAVDADGLCPLLG